MKVDNKNNMNFLPRVLLLLSLLLAGAAGRKYVIFQMDKDAMPERINNTVSGGDPNEGTIKSMQAKYNEAASKLKKKNPFDPTPKNKNPISKVMAIMGNEAMIKDKWYKAGDKIGDAIIIAVEPTQIRVKWDGKETTIAPIASAIEYAAVKKPEKKEETQDEKNEVEKQEVEGTEPIEAAAVEEDILAWMGVTMSAELRAKILEKWNEMSDEEKEQAKAQWSQMSDEQKQQAVDQMEENIDMI